MTSTTTIALAGNPNVGKSTIFNRLTGQRQHVGNWPGKTVEQKSGITSIEGKEVTVVDLPGIYSLSAYSIEEIITRDFIINERPSVVVVVVDASNLERNFYLLVQVLELGVPVVLALNMADTARKSGITINPEAISAQLGGIPVIETVGTRDIGIDALKAAIARLTGHPDLARRRQVHYSEPLETEIQHLADMVASVPSIPAIYNPHWLAMKLLEDDEQIVAMIGNLGHEDLLSEAHCAISRVAQTTGEDAETLIADRRYAYINEMIHGVLTRPSATGETFSDKIDRVVLNRFLGVPIFLLAMWIVFQFTANVSAPFLDWVEGVIDGPLTQWVISILGVIGLGGTWFESLVVDGVIAGVGGVLAFVPVLIFFYFALAVLEDSGYMARAAFVMDRAMRAIGLHGKSSLPLMVGFGCTVPAVYATRILEDHEDRKFTAFLTTFMSCNARLPVYVIFGAAFFGANAGNLTFAMYVLGILIALGTGLILRRTVFRHKVMQPFVMELPRYRLPAARDVFIQVQQRVGEFVGKVITVILIASVILWFLLAIPAEPDAGAFNDVSTADSVFGSISQALAPVLKPAGFGTWEATGSLMVGFVAKEAIVSTMSQVYLEEPQGDQEALDEPVPTLREDLGEIFTSLGEAVVLTVQEVVNIAPRTVNALPGVELPYADWLGRADEPDEDTTKLEAALAEAFDKSAGSAGAGALAAVAFNVFVLLYIPCVMTVTVMSREFGWRWALYQIAYTLTVAWIAAVVVFQGGKLLGLG
jgi:ferrous iron transport protein B